MMEHDSNMDLHNTCNTGQIYIACIKIICTNTIMVTQINIDKHAYWQLLLINVSSKA